MYMELPHIAGLAAGITTVTIPGAFLTNAAARHPSTPEHPSPFREQSVMGISHFYDHAGNIMNASFGVIAIASLAGFAIERAPAEKKKAITVGAAIAGTVAISGTNIAYEAGVHVPPYPQKPENAPFDGQDALYGSVSGGLTALVFAATTIAALGKTKRRASQEKRRQQA